MTEEEPRETRQSPRLRTKESTTTLQALPIRNKRSKTTNKSIDETIDEIMIDIDDEATAVATGGSLSEALNSVRCDIKLTLIPGDNPD